MMGDKNIPQFCSTNPTVDLLGYIRCPCTSEDYSVFILTKGTDLRLAGAFSFQVLYGTVEANGYVFVGKKYSPSNFMPVSLPHMQIPLTFIVRSDLMDKALLREQVLSRLREFLNDPQSVMRFVEEKHPVAILLIKHGPDPSSSFIQQQYTTENIFVPKLPYNTLAANLFEITKPTVNVIGESIPQPLLSGLTSNLSVEYRSHYSNLLMNINKNRVSRVVITGNKGTGKSTMMRYLMNTLNSLPIEKPNMSPCRIFLLDTDVGQSELNQPGCLALHEVKRPLLGASFASLERSLQCGYFFGSNSPGTELDFYMAIVKQLLTFFVALTQKCPNEVFVLFVNTVGWIDDLGFDLMLRLLRVVDPTMLINIEVENAFNFIVPANYKRILLPVKRPNSLASAPLYKPAVLRDFLMAGYFAQCFGLHGFASSKLRLASLPAYRVRFTSVALYFHPELHHVSDRFVLSALNCMVVALCAVEEGYEECFERTPIMGREDLPSRLTTVRSDSDAQFLLGEDQPFPMLRCFGHGFIRAISPERRLFYVLSPVDEQHLDKVNILAVGHTLLTPEMLLRDASSIEPAPYLMELGQKISQNRDQQKFYSPLRNITGGVRRAMTMAAAVSTTDSTQRPKNSRMTLKHLNPACWNPSAFVGAPPPHKRTK